MASETLSTFAPLGAALGALLALCLLVFGVSRLITRNKPRGLSPVLVVAIGSVQLVAYVCTFATAFGMGDSQVDIPWPLIALLAILSAPLMYLMYLEPEFFGNHWWGDDWNFILGLAVLNALVWGLAGAWLTHRIRRRHAA